MITLPINNINPKKPHKQHDTHPLYIKNNMRTMIAQLLEPPVKKATHKGYTASP
jgi:hypothetical protein